MTKEQILKKLEIYQEKSTSMEAAMSFGVAIKLVLGMEDVQELEEAPKDWNPKEGDWVQVRDFDYEGWINRQLVRIDDRGAVCRTPDGEEIHWAQYKPLYR